MNYKFRDYYYNEVEMSFLDHPFSKTPKHVLIICRYKGDWLLTRHKERGLEFPGGKVEKGETALFAAKREVMEETGGTVSILTYIGQYRVLGKSEQIIKNVYLADIETVDKHTSYFETKGPVILKTLPKNVKHNTEFSFIMKDDVLRLSLDYIEKINE